MTACYNHPFARPQSARNEHLASWFIFTTKSLACARLAIFRVYVDFADQA